MNTRFLPFARRVSTVLVIGGFCLGATRAPVQSAPAKASSTKGLMLEGGGVCEFRATFSKGSSNILGTPFTSIGRTKSESRRIVSSSRAMISNGYSVVVNFINGRGENDPGPPRVGRDRQLERPETPEQRDRRLQSASGIFTLTFSSPGGFRVGQTIPVVLPKRQSKPPAMVLMDYTYPVRIQERDVFDGQGRRRSTSRLNNRQWVAVSGTMRVQSVNSEKITFLLQNVRFVVPELGRETNTAKGAFILNGFGQSTFNEVD